MTTNLKEREKEIKNSYKIDFTDGQYTIMQRDSYFSEVFNDNQNYWIRCKQPYKTLKGAVSGLKKIVIMHFPKDYFDEDNDINDFIKEMIQ